MFVFYVLFVEYDKRSYEKCLKNIFNYVIKAKNKFFILNLLKIPSFFKNSAYAKCWLHMSETSLKNHKIVNFCRKSQKLVISFHISLFMSP